MGDPWIFLLDCADGAIYAWLLSDEELCGRRVASDFESFLERLLVSASKQKALPYAEKSLNLSRPAMIRRLSFGEKWLKFDKFNAGTGLLH